MTPSRTDHDSEVEQLLPLLLTPRLLSVELELPEPAIGERHV